jgi:hypothetical protein
MNFLDDANRLGLLRTVGPAYQFRHAEFRDHTHSSRSRTDSCFSARLGPGMRP